MADIPVEMVDNTPLGHYQLADIIRYLNNLGRPSVTNLGVVLGVLFPTMRDLPNDNFLNQVITLWLDKADDVGSRGDPSWRSLVQGLRQEQVRQNGVANNIAKNHCIKATEDRKSVTNHDSMEFQSGLSSGEDMLFHSRENLERFIPSKRPKITTHPEELRNTVSGRPVSFTVKVTGTEPLSYQWQWKPVVEVVSSGEWQNLSSGGPVQGADTATLTCPSTEDCTEGQYRCLVTNAVGEMSECVDHIIAKHPKITTHPEQLRNTVSGRPVSFSVKATGTEPLNYQWQWKPVVEGVSSGEWQNLTSGESVQGVDTATVMFTSIESCNEGLYRCVVTNAVGEIMSECADQIIGKIRKPCDVLYELSTLNQWYLFGIYLGLHWSILDAIKIDHAGMKECRNQMLIEWQKRVIPTWTAVVKALVGIGREHLASHIATKYGVPLPNTVDNKPLEELEIAETKQKMVTESESTEVLSHREIFQRLGGRMLVNEQLLKMSRDSQVPLNEKVTNLTSELNKLGKELLKLAQHRENTMLDLQRKQHDFQLLSEMKSKDVAHSDEKCKVLHQILTNEKKEIKSLKVELRKDERQLQSVSQEAQAMKDELFKLQAQLEKKHEEVKTLQKEKEELTRSYIAEKEEVKKLVQITLTDRDEMEQQLITTEEEEDHKLLQIEACESHINQLTEEFDVLSSSLQEKEATVAWLEGKLPSCQKPASTPNQLSDVIALTAEIAELKQKLKEAEYQRQQNTLEKEAAVQEMEAKKKVKVQLHRRFAKLPRIIAHPEGSIAAVPGKTVTFTVQATGTEPLNYYWQWNPAKEGGSEEWEHCCGVEGCNTAILTISSMQKSNEGSYHCVVSNCAGSQTSKPAQLEIHSLEWRKLPDMQEAMRYPQSVTMDEEVYIADRGRCFIYRYDLQSKEWTKLPKYQYWHFSMTVVNNQVTVVGGCYVSTDKMTNEVAVYSPSQRNWKQPYPPMNTPREWPAVSTYNQHLVVAGGYDGGDLSAVEILDTSTYDSKWLSLTPLPMSCRRMSAATICGTLYLLGGTPVGKQTLSISLPALTQAEKPSTEWSTLDDTPLERCTAINLHGFLLAVGGRHGGRRSSAIHIYNQEKNTWIKLGDLPTERSYCACCLLPSGEILVAGGEDKDGRNTCRMDESISIAKFLV